MKKLFILLLALCLACGAQAAAQEETLITLAADSVCINGAAITEDPAAPVYLAYVTETHEDVTPELQDVQNRVVTITASGVYRISGKSSDLQIAVKAGSEDRVRLILDNADITCRTSSAIICESAYDPRTPGEYGVTIELAEGSENFVAGSHFPAADDDGIEYDGAIGSQVSLGFEGSGSLTIDADNEGIEVARGHMTINGGVFSVSACDDPLNVSEDGVGTLTVNDGYLYSAVKPLEGGEGDGIDSNGYIVFNGGTVINLAHPSSGDSGIDSDLGSTINGGVIVGAGNMYDPIDSNSSQLFMMLEFGQQTDDLVVVTDENDAPVFAYDFPHDYMYIAFSSPALTEGVYHVYLGGEIEGEVRDGLYTSITAYTPGTRMQHGEGTAARRGGAMQPPDGMGVMPDMPDMPAGMAEAMDARIAYEAALGSIDLNELLRDADLNALLKGLDLNKLIDAYGVKALLSEEQIGSIFGSIDIDAAEQAGFVQGMDGFGRGRNSFGGMGGGPRSLQSSSDTATADFVLSRNSTGFTNVIAENP